MTLSGFKNIFVAIIYQFRGNVYENTVELIFVAPTYNKYVRTFTV